MANILRKVSEFLRAANPRNVDVFGQDENGNSVKVNTSDLVGDTGPSPNITIQVTAVPYNTPPSVDKSGTDEAPVFNIRFPLAQNGKTPVFQVAGGYMQYRYADTDPWTNLVAMSTLKGDRGDKFEFTDFTDADIAILQKPATDAAATANTAAGNANTAAGNANSATTSANSARDAANLAAEAANEAAETANEAAANVKDGKTPVFDDSSASVLDPLEPPTVTIQQTGTDEEGNPVYALVLGIPKGQQGIQGAPPILVNGTIATGAPGSDVVFTFTYSGVDEATGSPRYRIDGSLPQGAPGAGNGNVEVDASTLEPGKQYAFTPNEAGSPIGAFQEIVIPDSQVQADWSETDTTAKGYILNKPILATVATSGAYGDLSGRPNLTPAFVTGNTFSATATGVAQTQQVRSIQNGVGAPVVTQLPVATEDAAGVMPAASFRQIAANTSAIEELRGIGRVAAHLGSSPTQTEVEAAWTSVKGSNIPEGATVVNLDQDVPAGHAWTYLNTETGVFEWIDRGTDTVSQATNTSLGIVKGTTTDGMVFVESDGTLSVVGWDDLKQRVTNTETSLQSIVNDRAFFSGYNTVTDISTIPTTKRSVLANLSADGTLSLANTLTTGREMSIKARNTEATELTITLTNDVTWESKNTKGENIDSVKIPAGGAVEINIWALDKLIVKTDA